MFSKRQTSLLEVKKTQSVKSNSNFVNAALKRGAETTSGNGALKYSSTGDVFVDQFGVVGTYKTPRSFSDISRDMELAWASDKETAIRFALYLRMVSRQTMYLDGTMTQVSQKGAEMRHEGIMRMLWLHFKDEDAFWKNIGLFISVGSWKDIFTMLSYDLIYHSWEGRKLNWDKFIKKYNLDPKQYTVDYDAMDEEFGFYSKSSSNNSGTFFNQQFTSSDEDEFWNFEVPYGEEFMEFFDNLKNSVKEDITKEISDLKE